MSMSKLITLVFIISIQSYCKCIIPVDLFAGISAMFVGRGIEGCYEKRIPYSRYNKALFKQRASLLNKSFISKQWRVNKGTFLCDIPHYYQGALFTYYYRQAGNNRFLSFVYSTLTTFAWELFELIDGVPLESNDIVYPVAVSFVSSFFVDSKKIKITARRGFKDCSEFGLAIGNRLKLSSFVSFKDGVTINSHAIGFKGLDFVITLTDKKQKIFGIQYIYKA